MRLPDCKEELHSLLLEDVGTVYTHFLIIFSTKLFYKLLETQQRLAGASLLVFANKQDIQGSMTEHEIQEVCISRRCSRQAHALLYRHWILLPSNLMSGGYGPAVQ